MGKRRDIQKDFAGKTDPRELLIDVGADSWII
jgi:hypothetical protein